MTGCDRSANAGAADASSPRSIESPISAGRGIGGFAGGNARAWVLSIVRNTALTWLGKNRPAALVMVDDLEGIECAQAIPHDRDAETPETALITMRARGVAPSSRAPASDAISNAAAPSLSPDEFPAVTEPPSGRNAGLSLDNTSSAVSGRMNSS